MQADESSIFSDGAAGGAAAPAAPDAVPLSALMAEAAELRAALADTSENRILERIAQHPDITLEQLARPVAHTPRAALPIADQPLGDGDATAHVRAGEGFAVNATLTLQQGTGPAQVWARLHRRGEGRGWVRLASAEGTPLTDPAETAAVAAASPFNLV